MDTAVGASGQAAAGGRGRGTARHIALLLLVVATCALSGCTQLLSIGHNGVVMGIALDTGPGSQVTATIQMYHASGPSQPSGGGGGGGGSGGGGGQSPEQVLNMQGSGVDLSQAIAAIQQQSDVLISLWATNVVLLGSAMAQTNLQAEMNYLLRDADFSLPAQVAVVQGRASTLLINSSIPQGAAIAVLQQLSYSNLNPMGAVPISFWQFMGRLETPYRAAWAPLLSETSQGYQAAGTALFQGDRMSGALDAQQTWTLGWLLKRGGYGVLTFKDTQGETVSMNIVRRHLRLQAKSPSAASLDLTLNTKLREGYGLSLASHRLITALDAQASAAAQSQVRQLVDRLQSAGSDVLGLGELIRQRDPAAVANWPQTFSHLRIGVHVTVDVMPSGRLAR